MSVQELFYDDVDRLTADFERVLREFPEAKREVMETIGRAMLASVQGRIGGHGKVMDWQTYAVGSKGGYAAARPKSMTYQTTKGGRQYAVGYITNAIDNGHLVRGPSGKAVRYCPRLHKTRVSGKGAYQKTEASVESVARSAAQGALNRLTAELEG